MTTESDTRALAFRLWQRRGSQIGSPWQDWFAAERILKGQMPILEELALTGDKFMLYNAEYGRYVAIPHRADVPLHDKDVCAQPCQYDEHNEFVIQQRNGRYLLYSPHLNQFMFVSEQKWQRPLQRGHDNLVLAHDAEHVSESRNEFEFQQVRDGVYRIYNPSYDRYMFVLDGFIDNDQFFNVVVSHDPGHIEEERNEFTIVRCAPTPAQDGQDMVQWAAKSHVAIRLFSESYSKYVVVHENVGEHDWPVLADPGHSDDADEFLLEECGGGRYRLFNRAANRYLFVSNDTDGQDNILLAHDPGHNVEARNEFEFQAVAEGVYRVYNPSYDRYVFVSNDDWGGHNRLEAHDPGHVAERRNEFRMVAA